MTTAAVMGGISFVLIPLNIRFIITPLLLRRTRKESPRWEDEESREKSKKLTTILKARLTSSERMNVREDFKALLETVSPPDESGTVRLDFTILRALEITLMAYEDVHTLAGRSALLRSLMNRRISWFGPFLQGGQAYRVLSRNPVLGYLGRKGLFLQILRLALIPLLGIPGLLFYALRSLLMRLFWESTVRAFYLRLLFRSGQYLLFLYGGSCPELEQRRERFARKEIIRKGRHYDRELSILPEQGEDPELLERLIKSYRDCLLRADLSPDPLFTLDPDAQRKRVRARRRIDGFIRKTINALHGEITSGEDKDSPRTQLMTLVRSLAETAHPGGRSLEQYRPLQILSAAYKLSLIGLAAVYSNAPGSRFAMERMSVELFRKVREFGRQPLMALVKEKGMESWKAVRPVLKARQLLRLRKTTPAGIAGLGFPLLGRMIQDKTMELILYRVGRAVIRGSLIRERELPEP